MPSDPIIYLDYQASTPVDPRVLDVVLPFLGERFGNPASVQHARGRHAADALERARAQVAELVGAQRDEIIFTSGATEANNLALKGVASGATAGPGHIVSCRTEHPAVLEPLRALESSGWGVTYLGVDRTGRLDLDELASSLRPETRLVSVMAANNELGTVHPLRQISELVHARGALLHTDAAQAAGKLRLDVEELGVDLLSLSGHKVYAPQGVGALYVKRDAALALHPETHGGGQERGRRSGTPNTPGCVGLGEACAIASRELVAEQGRIATLRERLATTLRAGEPTMLVNGPREEAERLPGTLHVTFPGADADAVMAQCADVAMAAGSACASAAPGASHVLEAIGMTADEAESSLRLSLGRFTTAQEVDDAAGRILAAVRLVRSLLDAGSPSVPATVA